MSALLEIPIQPTSTVIEAELAARQPRYETSPVVGAKELYPGVYQSAAQVAIEFTRTRERLKLYHLGLLALSAAELQHLGLGKV